MAGIQYDRGVVDSFLELLRSGLYDKKIASFPELSEGEWGTILEIARKQTVVGIIYSGVSNLSPSVIVPENISLQLMMEASRIKSRSYEVLSVLKEVLSLLKERGFHPEVLKGPSVARFYPHPELRQSGDLDIFLPAAEFGEAAFVLGDPSFKLPDGSVHYEWKGVDIDLHRNYFDLHLDNDSLPPVPSPYATLVLLSSHILKHCMGPGIGLRQLCDMAVAYEALRDDKPSQNENESKMGKVSRETLLEYYSKAGILKWNKLLSSFLKEYLGTDGYPFDGGEEDKEKNIDSDKDKSTDPDALSLMERVLQGGNFGHHEEEREAALKRSTISRKFHTLNLYLKRMPFSLKYAPHEFWAEFKELTLGNLRRKDIL